MVEGIFYIVNKGYQKFLDAPNGSQVSVWRNGELSNKGDFPELIQWKIVPAQPAGTGNVFHIIQTGTWRYLHTNGVSVSMWRDGPLHNKGQNPENITWKFRHCSDRTYYIINVGFQKYFDTHGQSVKMWREGSLENIGERPRNIQWELHPVDPPAPTSVPRPFADDLSTYIDAFHQTDQETADLIKESRTLIPGDAGALGGGIYCAANVNDSDHKAIRRGWVVQVKLDMGRAKVVNSWDTSITKQRLNRDGFDSVCMLGSGLSEAKGDELVVYEPERVRIITIKPRHVFS